MPTKREPQKELDKLRQEHGKLICQASEKTEDMLALQFQLQALKQELNQMRSGEEHERN